MTNTVDTVGRVEQAIAFEGDDWAERVDKIAARCSVTPAFVWAVKTRMDAITFGEADHVVQHLTNQIRKRNGR